MSPHQRYKKNLQQAIRRGMRYWFYRMFMGMGAEKSDMLVRCTSLVSRRAVNRNSRRRRYWAMRQAGYSYYETIARLRGTASIEKVMLSHRESQRRSRAKWGGQPTNVGSEAWRRWMLAKHGGNYHE